MAGAEVDHVTLSDVTMVWSSGDGLRLEVVRISLDAIAGWWITPGQAIKGRTEASGGSSRSGSPSETQRGSLGRYLAAALLDVSYHGEVAMLIMAVHKAPSLTQERYEEVVRRLTGKTRIESASDLPFTGLLLHCAGQAADGFVVVDVFESQEAVDRFNQAMGSIPREVGIEQPPDFFPAHTAMDLAHR
jgi:hypothetical protein